MGLLDYTIIAVTTILKKIELEVVLINQYLKGVSHKLTLVLCGDPSCPKERKKEMKRQIGLKISEVFSMTLAVLVKVTVG